MNWWMLAGGLSALVCTVGHALAGVGMFYRPIKTAIADPVQAGVFSGMWHLITINFALSTIAFNCLRRLRASERGSMARGGTIRRLRRRLPGHIAPPWRSITAVSMDAFRSHCDTGGDWRTDGALRRMPITPPPPQAAARCPARHRLSSPRAPRRPLPRRARAR